MFGTADLAQNQSPESYRIRSDHGTGSYTVVLVGSQLQAYTNSFDLIGIDIAEIALVTQKLVRAEANRERRAALTLGGTQWASTAHERWPDRARRGAPRILTPRVQVRRKSARALRNWRRPREALTPPRPRA